MKMKSFTERLLKLINIKRAILLRKSNYGQYYGWIVEHEGKAILELQNPVTVEMFWVGYDVIILNEEKFDELGRTEMWLNFDLELKYRNKYFNEYAKNAYPAGNKPKIEEHIIMRALFLS